MRESLEQYYNDSLAAGLHVDPFLYGTKVTGDLICPAPDFFLSVVIARTGQVVTQWQKIVDKVRNNIRAYEQVCFWYLLKVIELDGTPSSCSPGPWLARLVANDPEQDHHTQVGMLRMRATAPHNHNARIADLERSRTWTQDETKLLQMLSQRLSLTLRECQDFAMSSSAHFRGFHGCGYKLSCFQAAVNDLATLDKALRVCTNQYNAFTYNVSAFGVHISLLFLPYYHRWSAALVACSCHH